MSPVKPGRVRELTVASVVFGVVLGAIMNATITYAGLKIGFTIVGSAIAAVLGFGVLRGILRRGSILEVNIAQTIASAVNTTNAGVIFTVPVLLLAGTLGSASFDLSFRNPRVWLITLACMAGAILGVTFIVPLRKQMIDVERLRFPSATAVAAILRSPGAGVAKSVVLLAGALVAVLIYLPAGLPAIRRPAAPDRLDALVARERVRPQDAQRTRQIAEWIAARAAPPEVVERGRLYADLRAARLAGDQARLETLEADLRAQPPLEGGYSPMLLIAVYQASRGERSWDSLRDPGYGWAGAPLPGYQDLQWRLPLPRGHQPGQPLGERLDRNRDGRPDLVLEDNTLDAGRLVGLPDEVRLVFAIAPLAFGAGFLTGRIGLVVLAGGLLATFVLNPIAYNLHWLPETVRPFQAPGECHAAFNRPLGIGLLTGGALIGIVMALPAIREAIRSLARAGRTGVGGGDEMPLRWLVLIAAGAMIMLLVAIEFGSTGGERDPTGLLGRLDLNPWIGRAIIALVGAAWIWFAGIIIAQCTGLTDWSPISGMALLTVVLAMLLGGTRDVVVAVMLGAALCVAIACAADMMADLRTGLLVGAIPARQQWVEVATAALGPVITIGTLMLIVAVNQRQFGVPIGVGTPTEAPQAQALGAVITGVRGGEMPYVLYGAGAAVGGLLSAATFPGLGVLVGLSMYLPVHYVLTYGLGCVANMLVRAVRGPLWTEEWGVPFCAGLIVGEALLALGINAVVLLQG